MKVNATYTTFNGEVNRFGIGSPCIFLRLQGCPIRCYKRTMGILCDTPEGLKKPIARTEINSIFAEIDDLRKESGIELITLTGGDPLWNKEEELKELLVGLTERGYAVSVETSGTISWLPYTRLSSEISWVIDYKLKSAGVKNATSFFNQEHLDALTENDFVKFVIYDVSDFLEMREAIETKLRGKTKAKIAVGCFWGGMIEPFELFEMLKSEKLLGEVTINMQTHKMAVSSDYKVKIPQKI